MAARAESLDEKEAKEDVLFYAVDHNNVSLVRSLIEAGSVDVNTADENGETALFYAVYKDNEDMVQVLIDAGADVNAVDKKGFSVLFYAVHYAKESIVTILIGRGANVNFCNKYGKNVLFHAVQNRKENGAKALIAAGAGVNITDNEGKTALFYAVDKSHNESVVRAVIAAGAEVNVTDNEGKTALFYAVQQSNNESVVGALTDGGADVIKTDNEGKTALFYAVQYCQNDIVSALIEVGADVNITDNEGKTALFYAVQYCQNDIVRALIDSGADVNITDNEGKTALFHFKLSRRDSCTRVARTLLEYGGALVDVRDHFGKTPLFYAITHSLPLTQYLLDRGGWFHPQDDFDFLTFFTDSYYYHFSVKSVHLRPFKIQEGLSLLTEKIRITEKFIFKAIASVAFSRCLYIKSGFDAIEPLTELLRLAQDYTSSFDRRKREGINKVLKMMKDNERLIDSGVTGTILTELFKLGANPNTVDSDGNTALHHATQLALHDVPRDTVMEICGKLQEFQVSKDINNYKDETPLLFCLSRTNEKISRENDVCPSVRGQGDVCRFLVRCGSSLEVKTRTGKTLVHLILELLGQVLIKNDHELRKNLFRESIKLWHLFQDAFKDKKFQIANTEDSSGNTPLHVWATLKLAPGQDYSCNITQESTFKDILRPMLDLFVRRKANLNAKNGKGETPLHLCRTWTAVQLLLDAGANPNAVDSSGRPPLLVHAKNFAGLGLDAFYPDVLLEPKQFWVNVLKRGLNPWTVDIRGESILSMLLQSGKQSLATALVEVLCGQDSNVRTHPLVMFSFLKAICKDKLADAHWKKDIAEMILKTNKCPVNGNDNEDSPLHYCCRNITEASKRSSVEEIKTTVHWSMAKLLRSLGADYRNPDASGLTCLHIAEKCPALKDLLMEPIDRFPVLIKTWKSISKMYERYLANVARHFESKQVQSYWYHKDHLASGAFGAVFAGINEKDGREVAIKRIEKRHMQRPEDKREIRSLAQLADCEQVVRYLCFFEDEDFSYIILELMEGNLDDLLNYALGMDIKVQLCQDIVKGLQFLHKQNFLHRDLKPKNILFKPQPKLCLKIADFGLSRCMDSTGSTSTVYGSNVGTRCWIAPEVLKSTKPHSTSSDVFACGLVLHYILSVKKHPFAPADDTKRSMVHVTQTENNIILNEMKGWDDSLCPEATQLLKAMLYSDVSKRPTAAEALDHLFFWTQKKKVDLLIAVGNQPEFEYSRSGKLTVLNAVESDLETTFGTVVQYGKWNDPGYVHMPAIYAEMTKKRPYDTNSVVELVRFVRNAYSHVSERSNGIKKLLLEDFVFLEYFPNLVMEIYKAVTTHGWDQTREEIKHLLE